MVNQATSRRAQIGSKNERATAGEEDERPGDRREQVRYEDLPDSILHEASRRIADYTIGFVSLSRPPHGAETGSVGGSGTLVEVGGKRGILTAWHVLRAFPKGGTIGLIVPGRSEPPLIGRWSIDVDRLCCLQIAWGGDGVVGPDLGFLVLPNVDTSNLSARKSFLNLEHHRPNMIGSTPEATDGIWVVCGFPDQLAEDCLAEPGRRRVKAFPGFGFCVKFEREREVEGFDYIDVGGSIDPPPENFEGCSGAGLWQVGIRRRTDGDLETDKLWFSGVTFWQSEIIGNDHRELTCHGRRSVYVRAIDAISRWPRH